LLFTVEAYNASLLLRSLEVVVNLILVVGHLDHVGDIGAGNSALTWLQSWRELPANGGLVNPADNLNRFRADLEWVQPN